MSELPINNPETFGPADASSTSEMFSVSVLSDAPPANPDSERPAVARLFRGDRANLIAFTFLPGQRLVEHKAAHPITVQALSGVVEFGCGQEVVRLVPGTVVHLPAYVVHWVRCPDDAAPEGNIMLLTMLTAD